MVKRKSNSRGSLLGRSSKSSKDKTGFYLVSIVTIVACVALFLMFSGNGLSILGDDSALVGEAKSLPKSDIGFGDHQRTRSTRSAVPDSSTEDTCPESFPQPFYIISLNTLYVEDGGSGYIVGDQLTFTANAADTTFDAPAGQVAVVGGSFILEDSDNTDGLEDYIIQETSTNSQLKIL